MIVACGCISNSQAPEQPVVGLWSNAATICMKVMSAFLLATRGTCSVESMVFLDNCAVLSSGSGSIVWSHQVVLHHASTAMLLQ